MLPSQKSPKRKPPRSMQPETAMDGRTSCETGSCGSFMGRIARLGGTIAYPNAVL
jgi:hypothetical protein